MSTLFLRDAKSVKEAIEKRKIYFLRGKARSQERDRLSLWYEGWERSFDGSSTFEFWILIHFVFMILLTWHRCNSILVRLIWTQVNLFCLFHEGWKNYNHLAHLNVIMRFTYLCLGFNWQYFGNAFSSINFLHYLWSLLTRAFELIEILRSYFNLNQYVKLVQITNTSKVSRSTEDNQIFK